LLSVAASSCSYDFDAPFSEPAGSTGADAALDTTHDDARDAITSEDTRWGGSDTPAEYSYADHFGESFADSTSDVAQDSAPDVGCAPGSKPCNGSCVPTGSPATGCAGDSCEPCVFDHGEALCVAGACALGQCENGWGNCDTVDVNGCEANLMTSADHCGSCGHACDYPHASGVCKSGTCAFDGCYDGWADCNASVGDGCEISTKSDDKNCGYCGHVCSSGFVCNNTMCRCNVDTDCDTGGGGTCDGYYKLCDCPHSGLCGGPCTPTGACGS